MESTQPGSAHSPAEFAALAERIRPELHRYCARMIGSVVEAEDVVQEALAKAYASLPRTAVGNMRGWLFRIAHNAAIDHLRRARQQPADYLDEQSLVAEPDPPLAERELIAVALSVFLQLAPQQRSCVILKDVLGYSLADISELLDITVPAIKAALHRGRARLRELAPTGSAAAPKALGAYERELLARYIASFNARDFSAIRAILADDVRLDLVNRTTRRGRAEVGEYFHRYDQVDDWRLALGTVERRPAILVFDAHQPSARPSYFILVEWNGARVAFIRDYRYATYVMQDLVFEVED
jgi:RNA polymerase sigma-70 factor (ECF subfamily)